MDDKAFAALLDGVREMGRHMRGGKIADVRETEFPEPDIQMIRRNAGLSQAAFARLIGVNLRTLQNWEQHRTRPSGPARALLKIVAANPRSAIEALHAA